jgi:hypothetical protein
MISHKQVGNVHHTILETLYNKQLNQCKSVIKNSFEILKKSFKKLLFKTKFHILILPDVVVCYFNNVWLMFLVF